jgi:hypothetical protein
MRRVVGDSYVQQVPVLKNRQGRDTADLKTRDYSQVPTLTEWQKITANLEAGTERHFLTSCVLACHCDQPPRRPGDRPGAGRGRILVCP